MKLSSKIKQALDIQINAELTASYHYLAMAAYFDSQSLTGFAELFRAQSAEETTHGMKIFDYVQLRGEMVKLEDISALAPSFQSTEDVIATTLAMEESVTASIHKIYELAESDPGTQNLMSWFIDEQAEEEDKFTKLLDKVRAAGSDRWRLLVLDGEVSGQGA